MMNEVMVFNNPEFGDIRTITIDNEPWFVAKDVCEALKHTNPTVAMQMLEDDDHTKLSLGRAGETNVINESGLYTLIIKSNLPNAKKFRKWVTSEVLPSIRKHGVYAIPGATEQTVVVATDKLIRCAEIMAGCLDGNRPYVLNILQHIIPTISEEKTTERVEIEPPKKIACKNSPTSSVDIDVVKMLTEMTTQGMTLETLAEKSQVSVNTVISWIRGKHKPVLQNRINICVALGKEEDFLTPRRKRNVR